MAAFNDHEAGNNLDVTVEDGHLIAGAFDFTEEVETPIQNLDADTEELDISHFVGDLRALMVDDSEDEIVLDSDDESISDKKHGKIRGRLWRNSQSVDVRSSAGSNLTDKVTGNVPVSVPIERSGEKTLVSNNDTKSSKGEKFVDLNASCDNLDDENVQDSESEEPGDSSEAKALDFVDHFLSVSGVNLSPKVKILKYNAPRSPFSSCAKGSQKLAVKNSFKTKIGVSTFDWDTDQPDHGLDLFLEKKREVDIQRDQHLGENCKKGLQELSKQKNDNNERDADSPPDMFDVGFDTQMAAEAMEALLYTTPTRIDANKKHQMSTSFYNKNQRELFLESPKKKVHEKSLKVYKRKCKKQDLDKENVKPGNKVITFSPVASRTRHRSSVKLSNSKQIDVLHKRKWGGDLKFDTWKWPKKKRTCRNMRENSKLTSTFYVVSSVVKSGSFEIKGNLKEAFFMSSVKRKARSGTIYRSTSGKKLSMSCIKMVPETLNGFDKYIPDFISKDLRRRRSKVEIRVLFSQNLDDDVIKQQKKILENLGICMVTDCSDATHFVADRFARTKKMLEAMGLGKQIVRPLWLESCQLAGCIIDEKNYILRDDKKEKELGFSMPVSLSRATTHPLLKDKSVFITPNVEPGRKIIEDLVKAVHGQVMIGFQEASMEYKTSDDMLILSCEQDYVLCVPFLDKGAAVYSSELLLNGIVIQKLEYAKHRLFKEHVIMKRYARKRKKNGSLHLDAADGG